MIENLDNQRKELSAKIPIKLLELVKGSLNDEQINDLFIQSLLRWQEWHSIMPIVDQDEMCSDCLAKRKQKIEEYSPELIEAVVCALTELAPTEQYLGVNKITAHVNNTLSSNSKCSLKKYNDRGMGDFLTTLGFSKRKVKCNGHFVFVSHSLLTFYQGRLEEARQGLKVAE